MPAVQCVRHLTNASPDHGVPPYWESNGINGFADVIIPPSVGTTLEVRCRTNATFIGG